MGYKWRDLHCNWGSILFLVGFGKSSNNQVKQAENIFENSLVSKISELIIGLMYF